ncbi:retinoic acid receptor alpha-like [Ruditapes philippinarum]|uniref:retinoic acid receptor alpha-like n=1 Tax=Ruditapes philippinarum TaxID=129788 RepID=UPI00295B409D|nr:retinoic acid receptor alpha-like [Ruditapes philippinarum]
MNQGLKLGSCSYMCSFDNDSGNSMVVNSSDISDNWNSFENNDVADDITANTKRGFSVPVKHTRDTNKHGNDTSSRRPLLPPCVVCGVTSTGFHYGANTCEACKGFFRRNSKKSAIVYRCKCTPEEQDAWKRGSVKYGCQACRFKRCLAVGMSKEAIKLGRYTYTHKTENIKRVKYIEAMSRNNEKVSTFWENTSTLSSSFPSSSTSFPQSNNNVCSPSQALVTDAVIGSCDKYQPMKFTCRKLHLHDWFMSQKEMDVIINQVTEGYLNSVQSIDTPIETIKKKQSNYLENYNLKQQNQVYPDTNSQRCQVANILKLFEDKVLKAVAFAKNIPGFRDLLLDDQASLIKAARVEMTLFGGHSYLVTHIDTERMVMTTPWGEEIHLEEINQLIPLNIILLRCQFARRMTELQLTSKEMGIFKAIITTASDRCTLIEAYKVDALQRKLVTCLQYLLNIRSHGPGTLLYNIFSLMTDLRELTEVEAELSKKMLSDWPTVSKDNFYLLKELSS